MQPVWRKIRQYKVWLILVVIAVGAVIAGLTYYNQPNKPAAANTTAVVQRGDIVASVSATGTISAVNSVDVSSRITGRITAVNVNENDWVRAGQVIILLDDTSVKTQVAQAQAQLANVAANYERSRKLAAIGGVSIQQLDADRTACTVAQATYDNAVSQLDDTIIRAPIDGLVIGKPIPAGQTVAPGIANPMVLLTVADLSKMQIQVQIDESDIGKIQKGQKVSFTVDAYPGKIFTGIVSVISQKASVQQNVVYYSVYVDIDSPQGLLFPTMTARVTVNFGKSNNVLVVPLSAVRESKGEKYVQLMIDGKPQNTTVALGLADDERVEVVDGLKEGDQIVVPAAKSSGTTGQPAGSGTSMRGIFH